MLYYIEVRKRFAPQYGANLSAFNYITGNFPVCRWIKVFRPARATILLLAIIREQITAVKQNMDINRLFFSGIRNPFQCTNASDKVLFDWGNGVLQAIFVFGVFCMSFV